MAENSQIAEKYKLPMYETKVTRSLSEAVDMLLIANTALDKEKPNVAKAHVEEVIAMLNELKNSKP